MFHAFASQDANISRTVTDLPGTLSQTTATLAKVQTFAKLLGPTATNLLPAAPVAARRQRRRCAALARSRARRSSRTRSGPFVVAARPVVRDLRPASVNLATRRLS